MSIQRLPYASCHYWQGNGSKFAVVLSCPGKDEMECGYPAASRKANSTGANLNILLDILAARLGRSDLTRKNVTVTNAWPYVEFRKLTGRTEARISEIREQWNIERLNLQLADITEAVLVSGVRAQTACQGLLRVNAKIIEIPHLGARGLNTIKLNDGQRSKNNSDTITLQRLKFLADKIIADLN